MTEPQDHDEVFQEIVAQWDDPPPAEMDNLPLPEPLVRAEPAAYVEEEEHFVPPPPPPVPRFSPESWWAISAIVGGLLTVFVFPYLFLDRTRWTDRFGVLAVVGGVALLVYRMRDDPHDGDDGAVL